MSPPPCKRPAADLEAEDAEGEERMEAGDSVVHNTLPGTNIKITTRGEVIAFNVYYLLLSLAGFVSNIVFEAMMDVRVS